MNLDELTRREADRLVRRLVSSSALLRGTARNDDRVTLLTVNYHSEVDVERLVKSFRRFVREDWPVVVVQNSGLPFHWRIPGARTVGVGRNLGHGPGLDLGMLFVSTEFTLICDPDSMIVGDLWGELRPRLERRGIAGIDYSAPYYHPACVAFRTEAWKNSRVSLREDWSQGFDVARTLTPLFGGLHQDALLPRTRSAGSGIDSWKTGELHYLAEIYGDVVSNTIGGSRALEGPGGFTPEEGTYIYITRYQELWRTWADAYLAGSASLDDFPD